MSDSKEQLFTVEQARELARSIARLMLGPALTLAGGKQYEGEEINIAGLIRRGAQMLMIENLGFQDGLLRERNQLFVAKTLESLHTPDAVEEFLFNLFIEKGQGEAEQIEASIAEVKEMLAVPNFGQKILQDAFREIMPKNRPGRPSSFKPDGDPKKFLELSTSLEPVCGNLVQLQSDYPARTIQELLAFLEPDGPDQVALLRSNLNAIEETKRDPAFQESKTPETRSRRLADAIVGKHLFGWSCSYSAQRGGEFRRALQSPE
jgi:hypothetical protein